MAPVPETEASVGRELDHRLLKDQARYQLGPVHTGDEHVKKQSRGLNRSSSGTVLKQPSWFLKVEPPDLSCVCRSGGPDDHGQHHECTGGEQQQQLCDGSELHGTTRGTENPVHLHRDLVSLPVCLPVYLSVSLPVCVCQSS